MKASISKLTRITLSLGAVAEVNLNSNTVTRLKKRSVMNGILKILALNTNV